MADDDNSSNEMARMWFLLTMLGAALYIACVFLFVL